ncbi:hypothetical protein H2201_002364 [Coniosporium apollinis]|uniref:Uncharacterized protein n=2 Tax=Coniosporium TaxID=2810619 RepID=A0ABQ9P1P6_9PEZI|nr:hypothetical protein H2199_001873 [Cladosporium sp. JES 115]KAJ9667495.1 hypothetical protein H2201_002364 [Coniosporium apollinis]
MQKLHGNVSIASGEQLANGAAKLFAEFTQFHVPILFIGDEQSERYLNTTKKYDSKREPVGAHNASNDALRTLQAAVLLTIKRTMAEELTFNVTREVPHAFLSVAILVAVNTEPQFCIMVLAIHDVVQLFESKNLPRGRSPTVLRAIGKASHRLAVI